MIINRKDAYALIQPIGRLDLEGGIAVKNVLAEIASDCQSPCHSLWMIDLTQVDFIDSAGLTALISGLNLAIANQCQFKLFAPHPSVRLVFEITRLDQIFEIVDELEPIEQLSAVNPTMNLRQLVTAA